MKRSALILLCLFGAGCSMVSGSRRPDGTLVVTSWRFVWKSEAINFTTTETRGKTNFSATLSIGKSATDAETAAAMTEAAVKAAITGITHVPPVP